MALTPPTGPATAGGERPSTVLALVAHARWVPSGRREAFAAELAALEPGPGAILVHTCHRVELYVSPRTWGDRPLPELPIGGQRLDDMDAARHLISVACGLDSAVLGEDEILHQLRETVAARQSGVALDPVLDRLFQAALHAGRRAHTWFDGPPRSLADLALDAVARRVGALDGRTILIAGTGRMGRLAALAAVRRGATVAITNRTDDRARDLARELGGIVVPFGADDVLPPIDGAVLAIGGLWEPGPNDRRRVLEGDMLITDLSSPPALAAGFQSQLGDRFVSVDDLAASPDSDPDDRLHRRLQTLVSDSGREYCRWLRARDAVPAIQAMADTAEARRLEALEWLLPRLGDLPEGERHLIEQMSHRLVASILHAPLAALNADASGELERAARDLFEL